LDQKVHFLFPTLDSSLLESTYRPVEDEQSGSVVQLPGLQAAAHVVRDTNDIAHVKASNEHDLFFLHGYLHAQDRLFQMDVSRREAAGTLAELVGPAALAQDVQLRTLGLLRAAERSLTLESLRMQAILQASADGVNAYVASHSLPPEYTAEMERSCNVSACKAKRRDGGRR
jgi:penicillin amidase